VELYQFANYNASVTWRKGEKKPTLENVLCVHPIQRIKTAWWTKQSFLKCSPK